MWVNYGQISADLFRLRMSYLLTSLAFRGFRPIASRVALYDKKLRLIHVSISFDGIRAKSDATCNRFERRFNEIVSGAANAPIRCQSVSSTTRIRIAVSKRRNSTPADERGIEFQLQWTSFYERCRCGRNNS